MRTDENGALIQKPTVFEIYSVSILIALYNALIASSLPFGKNMPLPTAVASAASGAVITQTFINIILYAYIRIGQCYQSDPLPDDQTLAAQLVDGDHETGEAAITDERTEGDTAAADEPSVRGAAKLRAALTKIANDIPGPGGIAKPLAASVLLGICCNTFFMSASLSIGSGITSTNYTQNSEMIDYGYLLGGIAPIVAMCFGLCPRVNSEYNDHSMLKYISFYCSLAVATAAVGFFTAPESITDKNTQTIGEVILAAGVGSFMLTASFFQGRTTKPIQPYRIVLIPNNANI